MKKYGFVYIWRDRKHRRYYIGSHWGSEMDGYICSSNWMRDAYKRRPFDFKRRIIARIYTTRPDLLIEEERWLGMIKPEEVRKRYYNLKFGSQNHWSANPEAALSVGEKESKTKKEKGLVWYTDGIKDYLFKEGTEPLGHTRGRSWKPSAFSEEVRKFLSLCAKKQMSDPQQKKRHVKAMVEYWSNPENRKSSSDSHKKYFENHPEARKEFGTHRKRAAIGGAS